MKNAENKTEKTHVEKINSILSKAELKKLNDANAIKALEKSKDSVSDAELYSDLSDLNVENLISKSAKNRSIWTIKAKADISDNDKTARRKLRAIQLRLSKALLHSIATKQSVSDCTTKASELHKFYKSSLVDFSIYSNVSETEAKEKFDFIHIAYRKMNLLIK